MGACGDYHVFGVDLSGEAWRYVGRACVEARTAAQAMERVAGEQGLDRTEVLWAIAATNLARRAADPAARPAPQPPLPDPAFPEGVVMTRELPKSRFAVHLVAQTDPLTLDYVEKVNCSSAEIAMEYVASTHGLDPDAALIACASGSEVVRVVMAYTELELAEDYHRLVTNAGVQGQKLWDHYDTPAYQDWMGYLEAQAAIDGLQLQHTFWLQTSFGEPLTLLARPNGKSYKLPLTMGAERRARAAHRDYGHALEKARLRAADEVARRQHLRHA
jgi:hypothetical protein